jgi:hypothetical protein
VGRRAHVLTAVALASLYLAIMSGHLSSMDGLYMERQAYAIAVEHSVRFQTPVWTWKTEPTWNSNYGVGLSLLYVPGMLAGSTFGPFVPIATEHPSDVFKFYLRELYEDRLYTVGASWVHAIIVALAALLVSRLIVALGFSARAGWWGMAFYGLGSSALVYARGDFAQPLEGLCWVAAFVAVLHVRRTGSRAALAVAALAVGYAILTRPVEGLMLLPAAIVIVLPETLAEFRSRSLTPAVVVAGTAAAALAITLVVNWARFGDALHFGYDADNGWVVPDLKRWAGALVSPGRGIIWEFPAVLLVPVGVLSLFQRGKAREALTMLALSAVLLINTTAWYMWWGGWCWGLRLFTPAIPLLSALAGVAFDRLHDRVRNWLAGVLLLLGFVWALPGALTDIMGGYGQLGDGNVWQLAAYPPLGAWQFLEHWIAQTPQDPSALDVLWFRMAPSTGNWSLLVPVLLLVMAAVLLARSWRLLSRESLQIG